jgi:hypothetical protein
MSRPAKQINPSKGLYIKLGRSGSWEKECLECGILRFGHRETPFDAAVRGGIGKRPGDYGSKPVVTRASRQETLFKSVISLRLVKIRYGSHFMEACCGGVLPSRA